jgi:hypothetical protein
VTSTKKAKKAPVASRKKASKAAPAKAKPAQRVARTKAKLPVPPPRRPGRGAPPPRISRAGLNKAKAPAAAAAPKKPSRQRVRICKQENCNLPQTTQGFCRLHYLQNWRTLKEEKAKRAQKNLDRYVERMAGAKKPNPEEQEEGAAEGTQQKEEQVFEEDFGEFVDVLSREENLDKILNGIKVEDY